MDGEEGRGGRRSSEQLAERDQIGVASQGKWSTRFDFEEGVPAPGPFSGLNALDWELQPNHGQGNKNHRLAWAGAYLEML
jgi:hypothetical protein